METLKLLFKLFDVSINTLLGLLRQLICQCCGMPLEDHSTVREKDGNFNENYCKWNYADGEYMYSNMDDLIDICMKNMVSEEHSEVEVSLCLNETLPKLEKLNALVGSYINLEYRLPNGRTVKYLDDNATYLGNQLEYEFGGDRCFGIAANMEFILISTCEVNSDHLAEYIVTVRNTGYVTS